MFHIWPERREERGERREERAQQMVLKKKKNYEILLIFTSRNVRNICGNELDGCQTKED